MSVVFTHHGQGIPVIDEIPWSYLFRQGSFMVSYFFVLSGFIMAMVYRDLEGRSARRAYWAARLARIFPLYILALVFMTALGGPEAGPQPVLAFALNATMLQAWFPAFAMTGNPPGWSLSTEAVFYLLFPFCLPLLRALPGIRQPLLLVGAVWIVSQVAYHIGLRALEAGGSQALHHALNYNPLFHLNSFLVGVAASLLLRRSGFPAAAEAARTRLAPLLLLIASVALIALALFVLGKGVYVAGAFVSAANGLLAPLFALFIASLASDRSVFTRWLAWSPLIVLGELSYGVYILQAPMRELTYRLGHRWTTLSPDMMFIVFVAALLGVSWLAWRWYEVPLRRYLRLALGGNVRAHGERRSDGMIAPTL